MARTHRRTSPPSERGTEERRVSPPQGADRRPPRHAGGSWSTMLVDGSSSGMKARLWRAQRIDEMDAAEARIRREQRTHGFGGLKLRSQ